MSEHREEPHWVRAAGERIALLESMAAELRAEAAQEGWISGGMLWLAASSVNDAVAMLSKSKERYRQERVWEAEAAKAGDGEEA